MRTTIPPPGAGETLTPEMRPTSICSSDVACWRDASSALMVPLGKRGGGVGPFTWFGTWWVHARTNPATIVRDGRTRIGYPFMGPPLLPSNMPDWNGLRDRRFMDVV